MAEDKRAGFEDRRAHERIEILESSLRIITEQHEQFRIALAENTAVTKTIAENTAEIVGIVKGAKGVRTFIVWVAPVVGIAAGTWAWIKGH